ncbi:MAG: amidohydrolase [Acidobacteria bacterium]|nr:amidohydrolase [Acidobacteriota bacterium]MDP7338389.1 amidohydrolase family protein [Vicinamibacterales bacterium]
MTRRAVRHSIADRLSGVAAIPVVVLMVGCGDPLPVVEGELAFVGVNVIPMDGPGGTVLLENQTVVVAGRRIASINPTDAVQVGDDVEVIEANGQYLMPGLAEMHGHLPGRPLLPADTRNLLFLYVANGVTTVRGMQGNRAQFTMRDQIARGETIGPRLFLGSTSITGGQVATAAQGAQLIREYYQTGYDLVKMHEGLSIEVFDAVAAMARDVGIPFGGHVSDDVGLLHTLEAGQVTIDHLDNYIEALVPEEHRPEIPPGLMGVGTLVDLVDEARMPQLVESTRVAGAWVVPTMVLWETVFFGDWPATQLRAERPELRYMPPETVDQWEQAIADRLAGADRVAYRRVRELRRTMLQALHEGGVPMLLGTDSPQVFSVPGFSMHHEMFLWVELGMTPYEVLESGTRRVAEYFDATDDFGSVAVGRRADLLLLTADPIADIANVARRAGVMVNGRWLPESQIQERLAEIATFYGN